MFTKIVESIVQIFGIITSSTAPLAHLLSIESVNISLRYGLKCFPEN